MNRKHPHPHAIVRLSAIALAIGAAGLAHAADPANGKVVYNDARGTQGDSCATCHTTNPARNTSKVLSGANNASAILSAINSGAGGMDEFIGVYTTAELEDMAAYLATCNATTKVCTIPTAAATIATSASSLSFSATALSTSSAAQTVTIANGGTAALTLTSIALSGANSTDFTVGGTCSTATTVAAGSSCTVTVGFTPTAVGTRSATLSVVSAVGTVTTTLTGTATSAPAAVATASTSSLSFGAVVVGSSATSQTVTVSNSGTAALSFSAIATGSAEFPLSGGSCSTASSIAVGGSCTVGVGFTPSASGARSGTLTIANSGTGSPLTVALSGSGTASSPVAQVSPSALSFAQTVGLATASQTITVSNTGTSVLTLSSVSLSGAAVGDYSLATGTTCASGTSVVANNNCVIKVVFTPTAVGTRSASLVVTHNADGSPTTVLLNGTGNATPQGTLTLNQSALSFASTALGGSSSQSLTLGNNGTAALTLGSALISGSNSSDFSWGGNCTVGNAIAAGASCTALVTFTPSAIGARSGTLTINTGNSSNPSAALTLTGTGTAAPAPAATLSATSVDLGSVTVGQASTTKAVTLTNSGSAALSISGITVSGGFAQTNDCGTSLAAGSSCTVKLSYTPTAAGIVTGTLSIASNAASSPATVSLSATGVDVQVPVLSWASGATALSFPDTNVGVAAATKTLTLSNAGPGVATLTQVQKSGSNAADFTITNSTCTNGGTIAVGSSCTVGVAFQPSAAGARTATLSVVSNGSGPASVALSGNGVAVAAPALTLAPAAITLVAPTRGLFYTPQVMTLTNGGTGALKVSAISATKPIWVLGRFAPEGGSCGRTPFTLSSGQSCSVKVTAPLSTTGISGKVSVLTSASSTPVTVTVTGAAVAKATGGCSRGTTVRCDD
jgi:hypothetical protein